MTHEPKKQHGGARPGAGRPKKVIPPLTTPPTDDPLSFLRNVMQSEAADPRMRLEAAKALLPYVHAKLGEGKKGERQRAAKAAGAGKFAAAPPPKLALVRPIKP